MCDFLTDLVIFTLWVVALARLTRLLTADEITDFIRAWVYRRYGEESTQAYFARCPWCVSMWVAGASAGYPLWLTEWNWWLYPLLVLAGSYVVGILASTIEPEDDAEVEVIADDR